MHRKMARSIASAFALLVVLPPHVAVAALLALLAREGRGRVRLRAGPPGGRERVAAGPGGGQSPPVQARRVAAGRELHQGGHGPIAARRRDARSPRGVAHGPRAAHALHGAGPRGASAAWPAARSPLLLLLLLLALTAFGSSAAQTKIPKLLGSYGASGGPLSSPCGTEEDLELSPSQPRSLDKSEVRAAAANHAYCRRSHGS